MKKRLLAILLLVTLSISFSGCNLDEIGFMNTIKLMSKLTDFTFDGSFQMRVDYRNLLEDPITPDYNKNSLLSLGSPVAQLLGGTANNNLEVEESLFSKIIEDFTGDSIEEIFGDGDYPVVETINDLSNLITENTLLYSGYINKTNNKIALSISKKNHEGITTSIIKMQFNDKTVLIDKAFLDSFGIEYTSEETINGVAYGKFTVDELIESYFNDIRDSLLNEPSGTPDPDYVTGTQEYIDAYNEGYEIGLNDGYFATETPYEETGIVDQDTGYSDGYSEGFFIGDIQLDSYNMDLDSIDRMQEEVQAADFNSAVLIDALTDGNLPAIDELIKSVFENFSLSLVKKEGMNKYVMEMNENDMVDSALKAIFYIMDNEVMVKTSLKSFVNDMSDETMKKLALDPLSRKELTDKIDEIEFPKGAEIKKEQDEMTIEFNDFKKQMDTYYDLNCKYSLQKTGSNSYDLESDFSLKTINDSKNEIDFILALDIISTLSINKEQCGEVGCDGTLLANGANTAKIKLDISDKAFVETGIYISSNSDFTNPTMKPAAKQSDDSYLADLSGLDPNKTYYYKSYIKDEAGNIVIGVEVKTFNTTAIAITTASPATGDTASPWTPVIVIAALIAITGALLFTRKKTNTTK